MKPVVIFLHRGDYDVLHQGLSIAASAVAMERRVELYFFWWALERWVRAPHDEHDLPRAEVADRMEVLRMPTLAQLDEVLKSSGLAVRAACSGSMAALGLKAPDVEPFVDLIVGWPSILARTEGCTDRFTF